ncbi:MAG: TrkH family potassium uptake protein [Ruminococcaceae bacterium]|nr:TrkH family potassium uptake protein [Oscillospiraceae bacterium]
MNRRMVFYTTGQIVLIEALMLLLPVIVSLIYRESCTSAFLITIGIALIVGGSLILIFKPTDNVIYAKEGFLTVALAWMSLSAIGALPFFISGEIPSYIDAFFETVSGFTTTGASILTDVESMSHGLLFWRSFTHWVGGMGVLVFVMAVIPNVSDRSIHIMRAEMPGPIIGKLVPKVKDTAKILYLIYIAMTLVQVLLLLFGGMSLFESLIHTFGTAGTGGFSSRADSIASYSPYIQWVITIFMLLFGINFNLYYLLLIKRAKNAFSSTELWVYLTIFTVSTAAITANILPLIGEFSSAFRTAAFQVASIVTTTGYATADFNLWPELSKGILLLLMFIGSCAGSTAGGLKISRVIILFKMLRGEVKRMLHPRSVRVVRFEGKQLEENTLGSVSTYFAIYVICFFAIFLLLCFEPFDMETNFTAAAACFNNVGPGFGAVGPVSSYADYSAFSKFLLSFAMLLGRLEIFPLIIALSPYAWSKK